MRFKIILALVILAHPAATSSACAATLDVASPEPAAEPRQEQAGTQTIAGRVVGVADGDTITVLDQNNRQHRIRLSGIDAPESSQAYGQASKQNLSAMVFNKEVEVTYSKLDRYNRVLGVVRVGRLEVNLAQVAAGYAWHYKEYQSEQTPDERTAYAAAETRAHRERKGLWQQPNPVKPSEYRRSKRSE